MPLEIRIKRKNIAIKIYFVLMAMLMIARYLLRIVVPDFVFLFAALIPVLFGSINELLACVMSYIPLLTAFQYKYALFIAMAVMVLKNRLRVKSGYAILLVFIMMVWELLHIGYGFFSMVEYVRGFAELMFIGALIMVEIGKLDHKLIIRSLSISVVCVCVIMFIMQLQQYNFNILQVFTRNAHVWRFGRSNMDSGRFALNFDANILGYICNLSACGMLLLRKRREHAKIDVVLTIASLFFAMITLSRAAIICMLMIIVLYVFGGESKGLKRVIGIISMYAVIAIVGIAVYTYIPAIFENLLERFQRKDVWGGRTTLFIQYMKYLFSSPDHLLFGIGMQGIMEKVAPVFWVDQVPHNGLQEVLVAWGIPGVAAVTAWTGMIVRMSKVYSGGKRDFYQFMPLLLTLVFAMSVQFLTETRTLLAMSFAYICLCIASNENKRNTKET